jgi:hypothetical protein
VYGFKADAKSALNKVAMVEFKGQSIAVCCKLIVGGGTTFLEPAGAQEHPASTKTSEDKHNCFLIIINNTFRISILAEIKIVGKQNVIERNKMQIF